VGGVRDEEAVVSVGREARRVVRIAGFGALTGAMLPALLTHQRLARPAQREHIRDRWVRAWARGLLATFGVRVNTYGTLPSAGERGHLVVANHRSTADILVLLREFGGQMVSRADLAGWPLVGAAARAVGTVFVDRSDAFSGANAVRAIRGRLSAGGTVIVFPEGTTFPDDEVRPFHAGAFLGALRSGADVVPVGIAYGTGSGAAFVNESFPAHLARMAAASPSRVVLRVGEPIEVPERARAATLRDRAHAEVQRLVHEARARVDGPGSG
jgi:1-acyl-sn-glycerol-3-phosphate acyltransferase